MEQSILSSLTESVDSIVSPISDGDHIIIPTLSIDIGLKHLGYSILTDKGLIFDIFNIEDTYSKDKRLKKINSVPVQRSYVLNTFLTDIIKEYSIERIVVERQYQENVAAMEIMYSIISLCITKIPLDALIVYDPKKKFTDLHLKYSTKKKEHKKLSICVCREKLNTLYPHLLDEFEAHRKKDDIADSIIMNLLVNKII